MRYWPWGKGGWIVAKFFFSVFMDRDEMEVTKNAKEEQGWCPANSWPNKLGKWRIYYMAKEICHLVRIKTCLFQETWKKANCVFSTVNPQESFLCLLTVSCCFLQLYGWYCPKIINFVCLLQVNFLLYVIKGDNPKQAKWANLAYLSSQSEHRIWLILPKSTASNIIT